MTIYLYVKTHNKTGLKYLGKTTKNPYTYLGSGVDWKRHLNEYGEDHSTQVIQECQTNHELNKWGRYYSNLWNVSESLEWANRIPETGGGYCNIESSKKISAKLKGKKKPIRTDEHKKNLSNANKGISRPRTEEHQKSWNKSSKKNWENNIERKKQVSELGKTNKGRKHTPESLEKKRQSMLKFWEIKRTQSV